MKSAVLLYIKKPLLLWIIEECDKGSFSIGCYETCGYCRDIKQCSNINGSCLTGCDAGFKGDLCKTSTKKHIK